jgi:hypothetical protein
MRLAFMSGVALLAATILLVAAIWLLATSRSTLAASALSAPTATGTPATAATPQKPADGALDAMVNACAQYMAQTPGMPQITPQQMKDMMNGMGSDGSGGMMQHMMGH